MTIGFVSFLFGTRLFIALKPRMVSFNFCVVNRSGTLTSAILLSRSVFTDISTHPIKGMFSSSLLCTLSARVDLTLQTEFVEFLV